MPIKGLTALETARPAPDPHHIGVHAEPAPGCHRAEPYRGYARRRGRPPPRRHLLPGWPAGRAQRRFRALTGEYLAGGSTHQRRLKSICEGGRADDRLKDRWLAGSPAGAAGAHWGRPCPQGRPEAGVPVDGFLYWLDRAALDAGMRPALSHYGGRWWRKARPEARSPIQQNPHWRLLAAIDRLAGTRSR